MAIGRCDEMKDKTNKDTPEISKVINANTLLALKPLNREHICTRQNMHECKYASGSASKIPF